MQSSLPIERWWIVNVRTVRKRVRQITVRADSEPQARVLACPRRGEAIEKLTECGPLNSRAESWRERTLDKELVYECLGDCASLIKVGVPLQEALEMQLAKSRSPSLRYEIFQVVERLKAGMEVPEAFASRPKLADDQLVSLVRIGMQSGQMAQTFQSLRDKVRKDKKLAAKVRGGLLQPAITGYFLVILGTFFAFAIIPRIAGIYEQFHAPLPSVSVVTFGFAAFVRATPFISVPVFLGLPIFLWTQKERFLSNPKVRSLLYQMPVVGDFLTKSELVNAVRNLAILLQAGVEIDAALLTTAPALLNPVCRTGWLGIHSEITKNGADASIAFEKFADDLGTEGPTIAAIVRIGEEGTKLPLLLSEKASDYEHEIDQASEDVIRMVGPVANFFIFLVGGSALMTTYYPILQLNGIMSGMHGSGLPMATH